MTDVVSEAKRILIAAEEASLPLRVLGGVAVQLRAGNKIPRALVRVAADLDFAALDDASKRVSVLFHQIGYSSNRSFNALNGWRRLMFFDPDDRKVDVFVGSFSMCHTVPLADRLVVDPWTIPLAELLLTKLQIVELNEKDVQDVLAILCEYVIAEVDGDSVNGARIATVCAADWGLWRTVTANLAQLRTMVGTYGLGEAKETALTEQINTLVQLIEGEPKTRAWRLRSRVGERVRWYELPEEVYGG